MTLRERMPIIAKMVGDLREETWLSIPDERNSRASMTLQDDPRMILDFVVAKGRIKVTGRYLGGSDQYLSRDQRPKSPSFADNRPDHQIAKSLSRGFIPEYLEAAQEGFRLSAEWEARKDIAERMASHLQGILGGATSVGMMNRQIVKGTSESGIYVETMAGPGNVSMKLNYLPYRLAARIARLIAAYEGKATSPETDLPPDERVLVMRARPDVE